MPFPGHVRPGLAIVRELTGRGHEVSWYTGRAFESAVQRGGATFVPIPSHLEPGSELWATTAKGQPASGLRKLRWDIRHGFLGTVPAYLRHLRDVFDETQPDVVVAEQGFVAAPLLAEQRDIPRVIFTVTPLSLSSEDTAPFGTGLPPATTALGRLRNRALNGLLRNLVFRDSQRFAAGLRSDLGLAPLDGSFLDWGASIADRYLHATIPEFEYPRGDLPDNVEFIGALLPTDVDVWSPPPWWDDLAQAHRAGHRVVFVTQGTVATDPGNLLLPAIRALAKDDVLLVATTGGADPDFVLPRTQRPRNLRLETFVPFTQLLPHVDAW